MDLLLYMHPYVCSVRHRERCNANMSLGYRIMSNLIRSYSRLEVSLIPLSLWEGNKAMSVSAWRGRVSRARYSLWPGS